MRTGEDEESWKWPRKDGRGFGRTAVGTEGQKKFGGDWIKAREAGGSERRLECSRRRRLEMGGDTPGYLQMGDKLHI